MTLKAHTQKEGIWGGLERIGFSLMEKTIHTLRRKVKGDKEATELRKEATEA